jgi:hypothetical protein
VHERIVFNRFELALSEKKTPQRIENTRKETNEGMIGKDAGSLKAVTFGTLPDPANWSFLGVPT